jgi:hypothetical protein
MSRQEEFDAVRKQLGGKGHVEQIRRRLDSDEPIASIISWYRKVEPEKMDYTYEGTVLNPLLRARLQQSDDPVIETARWFYDLFKTSETAVYHHMSHLEFAAYAIGEKRDPFFADLIEPRPDARDEENIAKLEATRTDLRKTNQRPSRESREAELRRRVSEGDAMYDTVSWFLVAIDAQAWADGGPEPDLSWFEREFLKDNLERYNEERPRRMSMVELVNAMALEKPYHPERPLIDMSDVADIELVEKMIDHDYGDSAVAELVKRANAKCITLAHYIVQALKPHD